MTEYVHVHRWIVSSVKGVYLAVCIAPDVNGQVTCEAELTANEIDTCLNEIERLRELEKACVRLYVGEITKPAWREFVRRSPEGQRLIALAQEVGK